MKPIALSAPIMFDLFLMCCTWDWENACVKAGRKDGDYIRPYVKETSFQRLMRLGPVAAQIEPEKSPFAFHRTTPDKVFRVLGGLHLITELQIKSMRSDRDLQNLFYRQSRQLHSLDPDRHNLSATKLPLIYLHDMRSAVHKRSLTRDVFYYPTGTGQSAGRLVAERYKETITKDSYSAEIKRQEERGPQSPSGRAAMMNKYRQKVEEETNR